MSSHTHARSLTTTRAADWWCMLQTSSDSSRSSVKWETKSLSRWIHSGGSLKQTLSHQSALFLSPRQTTHGRKSYTRSTRSFEQACMDYTHIHMSIHATLHGKPFLPWACIINTSMNKFQTECILHWQVFFYFLQGHTTWMFDQISLFSLHLSN